jgi:hypothetical protein
MEHVRKTAIGHARRAATAKWIGYGGGDLVDPRLFYFRALLASDRFFGGGVHP